MQVEAAIQVTVRKDINFPRKKNTGMYVNKLFSLTAGAVTQKPYYIIAKKNEKNSWCFVQPFRIDKMFNVVYARTAQK